jgi:hypothetical protein
MKTADYSNVCMSCHHVGCRPMSFVCEVCYTLSDPEDSNITPKDIAAAKEIYAQRMAVKQAKEKKAGRARQYRGY